LKRCPECNSYFPDAEQFCELDGTPLVNVEDAPNPLPVAVPQPKSNLTLLPVGVLIGVLLGVLLVVVYFAMSRQTAPEISNTNSSSSSSQQQVINPRQPAPPADASPSLEPSVEPSASPSVEAPSPQSSPTQTELSSSNPISTAPGAKSSGPVVIRLNNGATIEADEAWQTGEGIWYRKHSVVSLVDPKNVKAIEKVAPAAAQPTSSPSP
jgi:cytoskeletal protein RodZ